MTSDRASGVAENEYDVAVVGGGPAAMAFARTVAPYGLKLVVLDEQPRPGGQILRQPPREFTVTGWLASGGYDGLKRLLGRFDGLDGVRWIGSTSVLGLSPADGGLELSLAGLDAPRAVRARRVLVATGCQELAAPFPGWTMPGVMTAGGVQTLLKSQQFIAGDRILFCGVHPLQLIVADQVTSAGGTVAGVVFAQPWSSAWGLARYAGTALSNLGLLGQAARAMIRLRRRGVPILFGQVPRRALGGDVLEAVELQSLAGEARSAIACDGLALCYGFTPQSELPRSAGADFAWDEPYGGWRVVHDAWMRSSLPGVQVAGEVTGVGGAVKSTIEGEIAALGLLRDEGLISEGEAQARARPLARAHRDVLAFAAMLKALTSPGLALSKMACDETMICRCEMVRLADLKAARAQNVQVGRPSALKLLTRAGMGLCGARNCECAVVRYVAAADGRPIEAADAFTARFPTRSTSIASLL